MKNNIFDVLEDMIKRSEMKRKTDNFYSDFFLTENEINKLT